MTSDRKPEIRWSPTLEENSHCCASLLAGTAGDAILSRGRFTLALSGGSTPQRLYELLAEEPFFSAIEWPRVYIFWGDERCVPLEHPESNYRMARESLLDQVPIPAENIFPMPGAAEPEEGARQYETTIRRFFGLRVGNEFPCFDLVLLGLGPDGHTASLFPGSAALKETQRLVVASPPPTTVRPPVPRLTMTLSLLRRAGKLWFLVSGPDKEEVAAAIIKRAAGSERFPAARIRPEGDCIWFLSNCRRDLYGDETFGF